MTATNGRFQWHSCCAQSQSSSSSSSFDRKWNFGCHLCVPSSTWDSSNWIFFHFLCYSSSSLILFFCLPPIRLLHRSIPIFSCEAAAFVNNPSKNPANVPFRFLWIDNDCVSLLNIYTDFFFSFPAPNRKKLEVGSLPLRWPAAFC